MVGNGELMRGENDDQRKPRELPAVIWLLLACEIAILLGAVLRDPMSVLTNFALDCLLSLYGLIIYLTSLSLYSRYSSSRDPRVLKVRDVDQWIGKLKVTRIALNLSLLGVLLFLAPMALFVRQPFESAGF